MRNPIIIVGLNDSDEGVMLTKQEARILRLLNDADVLTQRNKAIEAVGRKVQLVSTSMLFEDNF